MYGYFRNKIQLYFTGSLITILILSTSFAISQTKTNLEVFYSLTDSVTDKVASDLTGEDKGITLSLNLGESYSIFANNIRSGLQTKGMKIVTDSPDGMNLPDVNLNLTDAKVEYGEMERDGWLGDYYVPRTIFIEGNYLISSLISGLHKFHFESIDSVKVDDIGMLESDSFPFTKGKIPSEPFFSSLWEPVIAIGVAAATVILFFSVRSK